MLVQIGSWKINVRDEHVALSRIDSSVMVGDGIDDIDSATRTWDSMQTPKFYIDTEQTGMVDGHGGSSFDEMTRDDLVALRTIYIETHGDNRDEWGLSKTNEWGDAPGSAEMSDVENLES